MTHISVTRWGEPHAYELSHQDLLDFNLSHPPGVLFIWNSTAVRLDSHRWDPRWEIWTPLAPNAPTSHLGSHPDRYLPDLGWIRYLQPYQFADGSFAPIDQGAILGLRMADWWNSDNAKQTFITPEETDRREKAMAKELAYAATNRYYGINNPIVGRYTRGDWRWRIR